MKCFILFQSAVVYILMSIKVHIPLLGSYKHYLFVCLRSRFCFCFDTKHFHFWFFSPKIGQFCSVPKWFLSLSHWPWLNFQTHLSIRLCLIVCWVIRGLQKASFVSPHIVVVLKIFSDLKNRLLRLGFTTYNKIALSVDKGVFFFFF